MKTLLAASALGLCAASCSDIPRDTDGSLEQIRAGKIVRIGLIAGSTDGEGRGRRLIDAVAAEAGARPQVSSGAGEVMLTKLEEGELDLVIGSVARKSPWARKVHVLAPLAPQTEAHPTRLVAMARNGENAWISLLHGQVEEIRTTP